MLILVYVLFLIGIKVLPDLSQDWCSKFVKLAVMQEKLLLHFVLWSKWHHNLSFNYKGTIQTSDKEPDYLFMRFILNNVFSCVSIICVSCLCFSQCL